MVRNAGTGGTLPARWAWLVRAPAPTRRPFAQGNPALDAVEIFFLKLTAFRQILEGLIDYYRATGRPHLDFHFRHLLFELGSRRWLSALRDVSGADPRPGRGHGDAPPPRSPGSVVLPGQGLAVPYAAPEIQEFRLAGYRPCELVFTDLDEDGTGSRRFRLRGRASDPYGLYSSQPRDTIFPVGPDPDARLLVSPAFAVRATLGDIRSTRRCSRATSSRRRESACAASASRSARRFRDSPSCLPGFRHADDLHARRLPGSACCPKRRTRCCHRILRVAGPLVRGRGSRARRGPAERHARRAPQTRSGRGARFLEDADLLEPRRPPQRPAKCRSETLWERAILLALRLVTRVAGFSVAAFPPTSIRSSGMRSSNGSSPRVVSLLAELQSLLFGRQFRCTSRSSKSSPRSGRASVPPRRAREPAGLRRRRGLARTDGRAPLRHSRLSNAPASIQNRPGLPDKKTNTRNEFVLSYGHGVSSTHAELRFERGRPS